MVGRNISLYLKQLKNCPGVALCTRGAGGLLPLLAFVLISCSSQRQIATTSQQILQNGQVVRNVQAAQPVLSAQDKRIATQVSGLFTNLVAQHQFSGSVLIAKDGQVLLAKGYGLANWQTNTPNTPLTRFYLGSVTKQFTAMSILILQQEGKLNVHQPLCAYINPCPPPWQPVTIHEVLTHTSGIPELDTSQLLGASPAAWIASFNNAPLAFAPGSEFAYCSVCYQILAYVVQQVSGQPYEQFVQQHILTPLHMGESGFDSDYYYAQSIDANGYSSWQENAEQLGWGNIGPQWSFLFGSGLLYSTVGDLYRWDQALYTNILANQQTRDEAFTSYTDSSLFAGSTYGYGWFITKSPVPGHRLIWHDGEIDGFRTYIGRYIDDDVTVIFLSNLATVDPSTLAQSVQKVIFAGA
jgi:CubicO group peptidase (beta-lactamase class C family)